MKEFNTIPSDATMKAVGFDKDGDYAIEVTRNSEQVTIYASHKWIGGWTPSAQTLESAASERRSILTEMATSA